MTIDEKSSLGDATKSISSPDPVRINLDVKTKDFKTAEVTPMSGG